VYYALGERQDAVVLALALIPVLGVDVLLEARSRAALEKLARAAAPFADVVREGGSHRYRSRRSCPATCLSCAKATSSPPTVSSVG
jgi:hypothetical protein